ncbi:hypothetical protein ES708_29899 [subsurface metagenome]
MIRLADKGFQEGHLKMGGRRRGTKNRVSQKLFDEFLDCLNEVEEDEQISKGKSFFKHIIEQGYSDKTVGIAVLRKLVPDRVFNAMDFQKDVKVQFELVSAEENIIPGDKVIKRTKTADSS